MINSSTNQWPDLWNWQYPSSIVSLHNCYPWLVFIASIAAECTEDGTAVVWQSCYNLCKLSSVDLSLLVGDDVIQPVTVVRDLGVHLDAELTMKQHISRVVSSCFFQLRRLRQGIVHKGRPHKMTYFCPPFPCPLLSALCSTPPLRTSAQGQENRVYNRPYCSWIHSHLNSR